MSVREFDGELYGIDLDGVCFGFKAGFGAWLEDKLKIAMPEDKEITSYYWHKNVDGLEEDDFWREFHAFGEAGGYRHLPLLKGTLEALRAIVAAGNTIVYITSRPDYALQDTRDALKEHDFPFRDNLIFANGHKGPIINERNVSVFIDDSPTTLQEICKDTTARIYCADHAFNRDVETVREFTRVESWDEFLEVEGIKINV